MKTLNYLLIIPFLMVTILSSCSKSSTNNSSARLSLLQQTWTRRSTAAYTLPYTTWAFWDPSMTFTFSIDDNLYENFPGRPIVTTPYRLLADDSTLIFTRPDTPFPRVQYDTNYITSLTSHLLAMHGFWRPYTNPTYSFVKCDTLWR